MSSRNERTVPKQLTALLTLFLLLLVVVIMYGRYRADSGSPATKQKGSGSSQTTEAASPEPASTIEESGTSEPSVRYVVVLIDGLNFRREPSEDSLKFGGLDKGERLILLESSDGWFHVKDSKGRIGWVSSKPGYARIEE